MSLPIFLDTNRNLSLLQTNWKAQLDPVLLNPLTQGVFIKDVALEMGANVINHQLGRKQQGWIQVDIDGDANVYRTAAFNALTLTLTSTAAVTVSLYVY